MHIQAVLHQCLGVAPPLAHVPLHLQQQQQSILHQTRLQRGCKRKLIQQKTSQGCTWNLRSGRNSGPQEALLSLKALHVGFAILTSIGFTQKKGDPCCNIVISSKHFEDYDVHANSSSQGGIAIVVHAPRGAGAKKPHFSLENVQRHGNNCVSCWHCTGIHKILIVGAYLWPKQKGLDDLCNHVHPAFDQHSSNWHAPVFMGDFNVDLETNQPRDLDRQHQILDFLAANDGELLSMVLQFRQRRRCQTLLSLVKLS